MDNYKKILFLESLHGLKRKAIFEDYIPLIKNGMTLSGLADAVSVDNNGISDLDINAAMERTVEAADAFGQRKDITIYTVLSEDYPSCLYCMGHKKPLVLYAKGNTSLLGHQGNTAVVGTRRPSGWSIGVEPKLVRKVTELTGDTIVSGLAIGCDTIAHRTAIEVGAATIAVLPCGLDNITPNGNIRLAYDILNSGGLWVSEYPPDFKAAKWSYVARDSLIAAISDTLIAMEFAEKSGTMHTVKAASAYGKHLAVYSPDCPVSNYSGNLYAMDKYGAAALRDTPDLIRLYNIPLKAKEGI